MLPPRPCPQKPENLPKKELLCIINPKIEIAVNYDAGSPKTQ
jgi:hypothetical protein